MARTTPKIAPFLGGSVPISNTWFLGPTLGSIPNTPNPNPNPCVHRRLYPKRHVNRFSCFCTAHPRVSDYFTIGRYGPHKIATSPFGIGSPIYSVVKLRLFDGEIFHEIFQKYFRYFLKYLYGAKFLCFLEEITRSNCTMYRLSIMMKNSPWRCRV